MWKRTKRAHEIRSFQQNLTADIDINAPFAPVRAGGLVRDHKRLIKLRQVIPAFDDIV